MLVGSGSLFGPHVRHLTECSVLESGTKPPSRTSLFLAIAHFKSLFPNSLRNKLSFGMDGAYAGKQATLTHLSYKYTLLSLNPHLVSPNQH